MSMEKGQRLLLRCVDLHIALTIRSESAFRFLSRNFEGLSCSGGDPVNVEYNVDACPDGYSLVRTSGELEKRAASLGELVYVLESDIVVQLQLRRPDLLFLHAAVVSTERFTCLLTGPSGAGKSTICWGSLHHGFRYTSDELAPIDLADMTVRSYAHALCLKRAPPIDYQLPVEAVRTSRGYHVPVTAMPLRFQQDPPCLRFLVFVQYDPNLTAPELTVLDAAEAAARLYPNVLNALAHDQDGLTAAALLASKLTCVKLRSAQLDQTCRLLEGFLTDV